MRSEHDFDKTVLDDVFNTENTKQLSILAQATQKEVEAGRDLDAVLTDTIYNLGLSYADAKKVEAAVKGPISKEAGLKSTLRKLRQQLNGFDHEDIEGLNKLISAIEGVEKQLDHKSKAKDERKKKRDEAGQADAADNASEDAGDDTSDAEPAEGTLEVKADDETAKSEDKVAPSKSTVPDNLKSPVPSEAQDPTMSLEQRQEKHIRLTLAIAEAKKGIMPTLTKIKSLTAQLDDPLLKDMIAALENKIALMSFAGEKYQTLLVTPEGGTDEKAVWEKFEPRLLQEVAEQKELSDKLQHIIAGLRGANPKEIKPYLKTTPTPKSRTEEPHTMAPTDTESFPKASRWVMADDGSSTFVDAGDGSSAFGMVKEQVTSLLDALSESMQNFLDLFDIAESQSFA